jgi:hypothetical protein
MAVRLNRWAYEQAEQLICGGVAGLRPPNALEQGRNGARRCPRFRVFGRFRPCLLAFAKHEPMGRQDVDGLVVRDPAGRVRFRGRSERREPIGRFTPSVLVVSWASVANAANCECPPRGVA